MPVSHAPAPGTRTGLAQLLDLFERITDPRSPRGRRHALPSVLAVAALATLAGARTFREIGDYARDLPTRILTRLRCHHPRTRTPTPPSEATLRRVLDAVDCYEADEVLTTWLAAHPRVRPDPPAAAIDAKALRSGRDAYGTIALLAAVQHGTGIVVGQSQLARGRRESVLDTMALTEQMGLSGWVVTGDAAHTCAATAAYLVEDKHAAYLFTVKGNTPRLRRRLRTRLHPHAGHPPHHTTTETGHGRTTTWQIRCAPATGADFPHAAQTALLTRTTRHHATGRTATEQALVLTSLPPERAGPARLAEIVRGHWHIENKVHWVRDVVWDEDRHRTATGARLSATLRNLAMNLIRMSGRTRIRATCDQVHRRPARALQILDQALTPRQ